MKRKKITAKRNTRVRREFDPIPWKYCALTVVCGLILVGGFFFAARQHFSAIDFGIKNAKLRKQVEYLKTENRLAILNREMALSGVNKAAQKIGFRKRTVRDIEIVRAPADDSKIVLASATDEDGVKAFTNSETLAKTQKEKLEEIETKVKKTVFSKPGRTVPAKSAEIRKVDENSRERISKSGKK